MTGVPYEAPLRCADCGAMIKKKPQAKTPKYCPPCRQKRQEPYRGLNGTPIKNSRQLR